MTLAIDGGQPTISRPLPHSSWPPPTPGLANDLVHHVRSGSPMSISDGSGPVGVLEEQLSRLLGLSRVLTASSGTAALHLAYMALDLPWGSEVVAPVVTFHASVTPALHCGLSPVLVDVDARTGNLCPRALVAAITERTSAVVVNHNWGHPADMDEIRAICDRHGLRLVEDCSHAYLSTVGGRPVGTFGDVAVFSMQGSKALPAGEGGFLATCDDAIYDRALLGGHYRGRGISGVRDPGLRRYGESGLGLKYRLHPLAAVTALAHLRQLPDRMATRMRHLDRISEHLRQLDGLVPPHVSPRAVVGGWFGYKPSFSPGTLRWRGRPMTTDDYVRIVQAEGLDVHRPSVQPLDRLPLFQGPAPWRGAPAWQPRIDGPLPGCSAYFADRLSLPTFSDPQDDDLVSDYLHALTRVAEITAAIDIAAGVTSDEG